MKIKLRLLLTKILVLVVVGDGMVGGYDYIDQKKFLGYQYDSFSFSLGAVVIHFKLRSEAFQK